MAHTPDPEQVDEYWMAWDVYASVMVRRPSAFADNLSMVLNMLML